MIPSPGAPPSERRCRTFYTEPLVGSCNYELPRTGLLNLSTTFGTDSSFIFFFHVATIFFYYMLFFFFNRQRKIIFSNYMTNPSLFSGCPVHRRMSQQPLWSLPTSCSQSAAPSHSDNQKCLQTWLDVPWGTKQSLEESYLLRQEQVEIEE